MKKKIELVEKLIKDSKQCSAVEDYHNAIKKLEQVLDILQKCPPIEAEYIDDVLWGLGNLYGVTQQHERATKIEEIEISNMLNYYNVENFVNARLPEEVASKLASLYLCLGTDYMSLGMNEKAREQYTIGYTLSFFNFGEFDERTLKQAYNIAATEWLCGDEKEGIRQIEYCYYDMRDHLGENSQYTLKAKQTLLQVGEKPDELYNMHQKFRKNAKELLNNIE